MATVQLRRYELVPGMIDDFLAWFPRIVAVRKGFGFTVLFGLADRENDQFVWGVRFEGDRAAFDAAVETYNASPERAAVFEGQPTRVSKMHLAFVEDALVP